MTAAEYKKLIDLRLSGALDAYKKLPQSGLAQAMDYSLTAGGKRIRAMLVLEFCRISGGDAEKAIPVALAVEMLHAYSLIHDDLPCMDDDDLRRGKPTNHIVFGEANAVIAGDALQSEAFVSILRSGLDTEAKAKCALFLAEAVGIEGMCGGQYLDMLAEGKVLSLDELMQVNACKTGALIIAACKMGVAAASGSELMLNAAEQYGAALGTAFQIKDDILDVIGDVSVLGKPVGSDKEQQKNTFMAIFGREKCENIILQLNEKANSVLDDAFEDTAFLKQLTDSLAGRND